MTWVKLDDGFWSNRKVRRAGESVAAYVRLLSWCGSEETDGAIPADDIDWICVGLDDIEGHLDRLIDVGLIEERPGGYVIPDFLEFNFSHEQNEQRRERDRQRKLGNRPNGVPPGTRKDSARNPPGIQADSAVDSMAPDPNRPDPSPVTTPLTPLKGGTPPAPLQNPCPRCNALPGETCTQRSGRETRPHKDRLRPYVEPDTSPIRPWVPEYGTTDPKHPPDCRCQGTGWHYPDPDKPGVIPCPGPPDAVITELRKAAP